MNLMKLYDHELNTLQYTLGMQSKRLAAHQANIANLSTPKYKAVEFSFEKSLQEAIADPKDARFLTKTAPGHMGVHLDPKVRFTKEPVTGKIDGNTVDLDHEMNAISQTKVDFDTVVLLMRKRIAHETQAINEGGGTGA